MLWPAASELPWEPRSASRADRPLRPIEHTARQCPKPQPVSASDTSAQVTKTCESEISRFGEGLSNVRSDQREFDKDHGQHRARGAEGLCNLQYGIYLMPNEISDGKLYPPRRTRRMNRDARAAAYARRPRSVRAGMSRQQRPAAGGCGVALPSVPRARRLTSGTRYCRCFEPPPSGRRSGSGNNNARSSRPICARDGRSPGRSTNLR